jgi:hypothetical protein
MSTADLRRGTRRAARREGIVFVAEALGEAYFETQRAEKSKMREELVRKHRLFLFPGDLLEIMPR